jgi:dipeptidyl aminopeptidase/acylaminoacyl peptidase
MTAIGSSKGGDEHLTGCQFATEDWTICQVYVTQGSGRLIEGSTRLLAIKSDGSKSKQLSARGSLRSFYDVNYGGGVVGLVVPDNPEAIMVQSYFGQEMNTGSILSAKNAGLAVETVDLESGKRKVFEQPKGDVVDYVSDGIGHVRLSAVQSRSTGGGYAGDTVTYMYRPKDGKGWEKLSEVVSTGPGLAKGFQPIAIDPGNNVAYGFDSNGAYSALYQRALDGSGATKMVLSRPDADVDSLITIGRNQRVVGASYATERRTVEYFDPELRQLSAALAKALPKAPLVSIIDASADESKLLIYAGSDTDPGNFYLFDKASKKLGQLLPVRPALAGVAMGQMKPVTYTASDGTSIPAYLTLPPGSDGKNLPAIVMPHGGPGSRDEWGFDWLSQYYAARGYAVLQPQFRGSAGFGSAWFQKNGFQSWRSAVGDVADAGRWLTKQGIADPSKLAIVGLSYGGYAALQSQVLDPNLFKAVVAIAPVTDLDLLRDEYQGSAAKLNADRFIGRGAHVEEGSPARHAAAFKAPVLMFHGVNDTNVGVEESRTMAERLRAAGKPVELVTFDGLAHQLDSTEARTTVLSRSDSFLRSAMGIK